MTTNGEHFETYKGWIINPGIIMPAQGIYDFNVYLFREDIQKNEPRYRASSLEDARKWIDEQEHVLEGREGLFEAKFMLNDVPHAAGTAGMLANSGYKGLSGSQLALSEVMSFVNSTLNTPVKPIIEVEQKPSINYVAVRVPGKEKIIVHPTFFPSDVAGQKTVLLHEVSEIAYEQLGEAYPHDRATEFTDTYWFEAGGKNPELLRDELTRKGYYSTLAKPNYERPPTPGQLRYITVLSRELGIHRTYEEEVKTFGEAGRMIVELKAEKEHRKHLIKPASFRVQRTTTDKVLGDLERTWHRIENDPSLEMQSALGILKEVMGYYYEEPCVVAWRGGNLVGIAVYETYDDANLGTRETHVKELASFSRVSGVGRLLVQEVIKIARESGSHNVTLSYGAGAKSFYEGQGFVEDTRSMPAGEVGTLMMYKL